MTSSFPFNYGLKRTFVYDHYEKRNYTHKTSTHTIEIIFLQEL